MSLHKAPYTFQSFLDLFVCGGIGAADKITPLSAEGIARYDRYMLLLKQSFSEGFIVHTAGLDIREGIEGSARLKGGQT